MTCHVTRQKYQFYFKMFRTLETELCAKSGSIALITFRNIAKKIFLPVKAFDPRSRLFPHYRFSGPSIFSDVYRSGFFLVLGGHTWVTNFLGLKIEYLFFSLGRGFWSCVAPCFQLFYVKDQCRMMYRIVSWYVYLFCLSIKSTSTSVLSRMPFSDWLRYTLSILW